MPSTEKKTSTFTWLIVILVFSWVVSRFSTPPSPGPSTAKATAELSLPPEKAAVNNLKLDFAWEKKGFGNVMEVNFTVANNNAHQVKDIEITCEHFAKSGTRLDSNTRTIFDIVPARGKKSFDKFNMGFIHSQAEKTSCIISNLKI